MIRGIVFISLKFFIPVLVLMICYGQIIWVLTRRINTDLMKNNPTVDNAEANSSTTTQVKDIGKDMFQLARRNTFKTLLIVGLCFIICWAPNQIIYFMYNFGMHVNFNSASHQFTVLMVLLNCSVNPFIYLIKYRDYQEAFRTFFHCKKTRESKNSLNPSVMQTSNSTMMTDSQ